MSESFSTAVEAIYDALSTTGRWGSALAAIAEFVEASAGLVLFSDTEGRVLALAVHGFDDVRLLASDSLPGVARATETLLSSQATGTALSVVFSSRSAQTRTIALVRLASEGGFGAALGAALVRDECFLASLWLFREQSAPFDDSAHARLHRVVPHLQRALSVQRRLDWAESRAEAGWQAFERVVLGAVVVDRDGKPLLVNRAAKRVAAQHDGFEIGTSGLTGLSAADTRALHLAIYDVSRGRAAGGHALALPRRSGGRPLQVMVVPVRRSAWPFFGRRPSAIVFISDWAGTSPSISGFVRELYGLTAAETRLALLLLGGQGLAEAATALGISRNTAHTHLGRIFRKTHTASQAELVRALLSGPAAVRPPSDSSLGRSPVN